MRPGNSTRSPKSIRSAPGGRSGETSLQARTAEMRSPSTITVAGARPAGVKTRVERSAFFILYVLSLFREPESKGRIDDFCNRPRSLFDLLIGRPPNWGHASAGSAVIRAAWLADPG